MCICRRLNAHNRLSTTCSRLSRPIVASKNSAMVCSCFIFIRSNIGEEFGPLRPKFHRPTISRGGDVLYQEKNASYQDFSLFPALAHSIQSTFDSYPILIACPSWFISQLIAWHDIGLFLPFFHIS